MFVHDTNPEREFKYPIRILKNDLIDIFLTYKLFIYYVMLQKVENIISKISYGNNNTYLKKS